MCYSEGKPRASKILRETSFEFVLLGWRWQYKSCCSKTSVAICACLKTVYTVAKSVQEPSIMEKYPILQICRTAGFKIDLYIPMPETFCQLSGKGDFALLLLTSFEKLLGFLLYLFPPVSDRDEWFSNLDTEDALDFEDNLDSWLLCI